LLLQRTYSKYKKDSEELLHQKSEMILSLQQRLTDSEKRFTQIASENVRQDTVEKLKQVKSSNPYHSSLC